MNLARAVISVHCVRLRIGLGVFLSTLNLEITDENSIRLRLYFNYEDVNTQTFEYRVRIIDWKYKKFQKMKDEQLFRERQLNYMRFSFEYGVWFRSYQWLINLRLFFIHFV